MEYRYCPLCATPLETVAPKMQKCPACGFFYFPKVGACAVGIVHDGERILLDKRAYDPGKGLWALLGGYLELNEDPADALLREVREESGLEIEIEEMLGIKVGGPTCGVIFSARVVGGQLRGSAESTQIDWFARDEIPWDRMAFRLHKEALANWLEGRGLAQR